MLSCCFLVVLLWSPLAHGQVFTGARAGLGFPAIINQNNYGQSELDYNVTIKPTGSVLLGYNLESDNELQLRIAYRGMGQSYTGMAQSTTYDRAINISTLEVIGVYRFDFAPANNVIEKLYFLIGPRIGFILSAEQEFEINGNATDFLTYALDRVNPNEDIIRAQGEPKNHKDFFTSYDLGLFGGMGFESTINDQLYWNVELIGSIGVTDVNNFNWKLPNREESIYESSYNFMGGISAGITYYFDIRRTPKL